MTKGATTSGNKMEATNTAGINKGNINKYLTQSLSVKVMKPASVKTDWVWTIIKDTKRHWNMRLA